MSPLVRPARRVSSPLRVGSWPLRVAVVAAVAAGLLTAVANPAYADHDLRLDNIGNIELRAGGGSQNVQLRVENRGGGIGGHTSPDGVARNVQLTMTVPGGLGVVITGPPPGCTPRSQGTAMDCTIGEIPAGQAFTGVVQVGAEANAPVQAGESRTESATVTITSHNGGNQSFNVKVNGPDRPPVAGDITGIVANQNNGDPIDAAKVLLVDSQGASFETTTNGQGEFRFTGQEIAPGTVGLSASKDGFQSGGEQTHNVQAGQPLGGLRLTLISTATTAPPTSAPPTTAPPTATASGAPATAPASGGSFFTTLLVVLGVLFVALGVGAIVLLIIRQRRRAREEGEDDGFDGAGDPTAGPRGPGPTPGSRGVYRPTPTQVAGASQTQVMGPGGTLPAVGPRPVLANAPTMLQRGATSAETAMIPRAGDPTGVRPPGPGGPGGPGATMPGGPGAPPVPGGGPGVPPGPRPGAPQSTTYGGAAPAGRYDDGQRGGYGGERGGQYGSPAGPAGPAGAGGYGSPAAPDSGGGGYGADRSYGGYDQPTGRHGRAGYEQPDPSYRTDSYGPDPYTPQGGAGRAQYPPTSPEPSGYADPRYQGQGGYADQGYDQGGYGGQGYESRGYEGGRGHEGQGYDDQRYQDQRYAERGQHAGGGYPADPAYGQAPPEPPAPEADYDESGRRSRHSEPPERRRLDWLD